MLPGLKGAKALAFATDPFQQSYLHTYLRFCFKRVNQLRFQALVVRRAAQGATSTAISSVFVAPD